MEDARASTDRETLALLQAPVAPAPAGPLLAPKASTNTLVIVILVIVSVIALLVVLGYFGYNYWVQRAASAVTAPVRAATRATYAPPP
jgi:cytochrome bd-type quinol oxidase subunit 2